jgi:hypothetical protein
MPAALPIQDAFPGDRRPGRSKRMFARHALCRHVLIDGLCCVEATAETETGGMEP